MFHPHLKTLIRFTEAELSDAKREKISRHLETCRKCREKVSGLEEVSALYSTSIELSPDIDEKIKAGISEIKRSDKPDYAEIISVIGSLFIFTDETENAINGLQGMMLRRGDHIRLGERSKALIQLLDGSVMYINEDTEITLGDKLHNLSMRTGEFFAMMKPQKERFTIHTPTAVLGVVGTDFDTHVSKEKGTTLKVLKGTVSYKNDSGEVLVKGKQQAAGTEDNGPRATRISDTGRITDWTRSLNKEKKKENFTMKIIGIILAVIIAAAGLWFFNQQTENIVGTSADSAEITREKFLDDLREIQSNSDFKEAIYNSPLYLIEQSSNLTEYARNLTNMMPDFVKDAIPDEMLMKIVGDAGTANDTPAAFKQLRYIFENTKIINVDMEENPSEGSIAIVQIDDPANNIENNYSYWILYYEDGLWKFVSDRSTTTEPNDMQKSLSQIGLVIEDYKLKDYSGFIKNLRAALQQRM